MIVRAPSYWCCPMIRALSKSDVRNPGPLRSVSSRILAARTATERGEGDAPAVAVLREPAAR